MRETFTHSPEENHAHRFPQPFEATLPPELRLVPLIVAFVVGAELVKKRGKDDKPKAPPPVAIKEVKETPITRTEELKIEATQPKEKTPLPFKEKRIEEKEMFKKREIREVYNLVYYDPEKEEKRIVQVEQPIFYDTLEQKTVDESEAMRSEAEAMKFLADPLLPKDPSQIEAEVEKRVGDQKKSRGFGKDLQTEMLKELDDAVQSTPENIAEVEKRKAALIKELEEREKLLEEALELLRKEDFDGFKAMLDKFPPLLRVRLEAIMEEREKLVFQFLLVELHFIKWLKSKIKALSLKEIEKLAKALASYTILGALKKALSKDENI